MTPPGHLFAYEFLSRGATAWVFKISNPIALKYAADGRIDAFNHENATYDLFEKHEPCPHIVQSFLRLPGVNFLAFMAGGTLEKRLGNNQRRDGDDNLLCVSQKEATQKVEQWAMELSSAVAWLEGLGLVHGDLRPPNLLLNSTDHLKLADFDCASAIGSDSQGNAPPWARLRGNEAGNDHGTWGVNGPQTEQFAVGSIIYAMTRGYEPYEDRACGPEIVLLLQNMEFPELGDGYLDRVIHQCWHGLYESLQDLAREMKSLAGASNLPHATLPEACELAKMREQCQHLVDNGLIR